MVEQEAWAVVPQKMDAAASESTSTGTGVVTPTPRISGVRTAKMSANITLRTTGHKVVRS
jgi:hypothetical protein